MVREVRRRCLSLASWDRFADKYKHILLDRHARRNCSGKVLETLTCLARSKTFCQKALRLTQSRKVGASYFEPEDILTKLKPGKHLSTELWHNFALKIQSKFLLYLSRTLLPWLRFTKSRRKRTSIFGRGSDQTDWRGLAWILCKLSPSSQCVHKSSKRERPKKCGREFYIIWKLNLEECQSVGW